MYLQVKLSRAQKGMGMQIVKCGVREYGQVCSRYNMYLCENVLIQHGTMVQWNLEIKRGKRDCSKQTHEEHSLTTVRTRRQQELPGGTEMCEAWSSAWVWGLGIAEWACPLGVPSEDSRTPLQTYRSIIVYQSTGGKFAQKCLEKTGFLLSHQSVELHFNCRIANMYHPTVTRFACLFNVPDISSGIFCLGATGRSLQPDSVARYSQVSHAPSQVLSPCARSSLTFLLFKTATQAHHSHHFRLLFNLSYYFFSLTK